MHWYDSKTGEPRYEIPYANGRPGMREPTLADAKKLGYVPSVTTVLAERGKPGLVNWMIDQAIYAALTNPVIHDAMPHEEMLAVIRKDAKEQARKAAQRGTEIHDAIEKHMAHGIDHPDYAWHVKGAVSCLADYTGPQVWTAEAHLPGGLGYGGRIDLYSDEWLIDFKTKEFREDDKIKGWPEQHTQLAAYSHGLGRRLKLANIFVSTTEPGLAVFYEWPDADYAIGLRRWQNALEGWYYWNDPEGKIGKP